MKIQKISKTQSSGSLSFSFQKNESDLKNILLTHFRTNLERFEESYAAFLFKECLNTNLKAEYLLDVYSTAVFKEFIKPISSFWYGCEWEFFQMACRVLSESFFVKSGLRKHHYYVFNVDFPREAWKKMGSLLFPFLFTFTDAVSMRDVFLLYTDVLDMLSGLSGKGKDKKNDFTGELKGILCQMNSLLSDVISNSLAEVRNLKRLVQNWVVNLNLICSVQQEKRKVTLLTQSVQKQPVHKKVK